jgi:hypothetical protein
MNGMMGANLADLDQLKRTFTEVARAITECQTRVNGALGSTNWTGTAAAQFREMWNGEYAPAFRKCAADLEQKAGYIGQRREAIDRATSAL